MVTALCGGKTGARVDPGARTLRPPPPTPRGVDPDQQASVLLLSTPDTDLLAARASSADYRLANPARLPAADLPPLLDGADAVVGRLLRRHPARRAGVAGLG